MIITGPILRVIFSQDDYFAVDVQSTSGKTAITGTLIGLPISQITSPLSFSGEWVNHPKFGRQFKAVSWDPPENLIESDKYNLLRAFFSKTESTALIREFGEGVWAALDSLERIPESIKSLRTEVEEGAVPPPNADDFQTHWLSWSRCRNHSRASVFLSGSFEAKDIESILTSLGDDALLKLNNNPYEVLRCPRISWAKADAFSKDRGFQPHQRIAGALLRILSDLRDEGHLYLPKARIGSSLEDFQDNALGKLSLPDVQQALRALRDSGSVAIDPEHGVYLSHYFKWETESAGILAGLASHKGEPIQGFDLNAFFLGFEARSGWGLSTAQKDAVTSLVDNRVLVLTGLPGTGKTTVVKAIVEFFRQNHMPCKLLAPTGIAAKRLTQVVGEDASTIHRALGYNGSTWGLDETNHLVEDVVIVDEMSMVCQEVFYRLLVALRPGTRLILVGDSAQLPSVGPGNVLRELDACLPLNRVKLTQIFRQLEDGSIVSNAHKIHRGNYPVFGSEEFQLISLGSDTAVCDKVVSIAQALKEDGANFQVLTTMHKGDVGVTTLNSELQEALNPAVKGAPEKGDKRWSTSFRVGDRMMVVKNNYKLGVVNGDIGRLDHVLREGYHVRLYGNEAHSVFVPRAEASDYLKLAYAITVHKSQGSEFDTVIIALTSSMSRMLQRNLLYTGVTRARRRVIIVGSEKAVRTAVDRNHIIRRNTALGSRVAGVLAQQDDPGACR